VSVFNLKAARVRVHFAGTKPGRRLSAAQVLADTVPDDEIAGGVMLVGTTASALADVRSTPLEGAVPGVDIHAEPLEHILSGAHLARPDFATGLEALFLVLGDIPMKGKTDTTPVFARHGEAPADSDFRAFEAAHCAALAAAPEDAAIAPVLLAKARASACSALSRILRDAFAAERKSRFAHRRSAGVRIFVPA